MLLTREQLQERLVALHAASLELVKDVSLEHLLKQIATLAREQAEARYAALGVLDDEGKLDQFITVGMADDEIKRISHLPVGRGLIRELMDTETPLRVANISEHPHSSGFPANHPQMTSFLGVPIRALDRQLGQIYLTDKLGASEFTADDENIIQMLAAYAAAAIQNARLLESSRLLAILEERNRIGMDLHDGIIQSIFAVGLSLDNALHNISEDANPTKAVLREAIDGLNQAIRDIRAYIMDLRPRQLGTEGLMSGLKRLASEYRDHTFSEVTLTGPNADIDRDLSQSESMVLFHICQEALANAAKHSNAKQVEINVWLTTDRVLMEIRDDGRGFDLENMAMTLGHGLANIQTRARSVGGDVDITSISGEGTMILAWVPRRAQDSPRNADSLTFESLEPDVH